jgi:phosphorylcholine metabolism protein LicD
MATVSEQFDELINILEDAQVDYWMDSGSLLGLVREGHLLEDDLDIDIGVLYNCDLTPVLAKLKDSGYKARKFFPL